MQLSYLAALGHYIPELIVCITMVGLLVLEATYNKNEQGRGLLYSGAMIGLFIAFCVTAGSLTDIPVPIFTNSVVIDPFSGFLKCIMILGTMGAIYLASQSKDIYSNLKAEFVIMATGVLMGGMLLASANNMLILYLGIETLSILSYALASFRKTDERSSEAGLKYALYGGVSAGIMLFGMSHIFGVLGTIQFSEIGATLNNLSAVQLSILIPSFLMFFAGLGYKLACAPFHMWTPDVYEGSPLPVTAFFAIVPKMAALGALTRVTFVFFQEPGLLQDSWVGILQVVAALTMTVGNVGAIGQRSVKRMLAYSSIGHAGMMIMGVVVINEVGARAILFYGSTYLFMTLVAFLITSFINDKYGNDHFERFNGLIYRYPMMAIAMALVMFSLAGVPPLSGFVAKFNILSAVIEKKYYMLALIGGLNSVVSLYYYLKIVRLMVFKESESSEKIDGLGFLNQAIVVALTVPVVFLGIFWSKLIVLAESAKILIQ